LIITSLRYRLDPNLSEVVLRVVPDARETVLRGFDRAVAVVADGHALIDRLQIVLVAPFDDLLQAVA